MKGGEILLIRVLSGNNDRFVIPVYQRCYSWGIEQCKQLYDDLVAMVRHKRSTHFFGSIVVSNQTSRGCTAYIIIDGQQRITTISLLLLALHKLLEHKKIQSTDANLSQKILTQCLIDQYETSQQNKKLKPIQNDANAYLKLFGSADEFQADSKMTINYQYFCSRILREEISVDELYQAICQLMVIHIQIDPEDDPQLIFESLNSTGLDLNEGDKIRNFILMGLNTQMQENYYHQYWNPIEADTMHHVSAFVRDYLSLKMQSIPPQQRVYPIFKSYVFEHYQENGHVDTERLLKDLRQYAACYRVLLAASSNDRILDACIMRLNRLETTVTRPFFLEVIKMYRDKTLGIEDVRQIFLTTENYLFRRYVCELPTNALNKIYMSLHKDVERLDPMASYLERYKYLLLNKKDKARFPKNDEFQKRLGERSIYDMNSKNKIYILERFENSGTLEDKDVYRHVTDGTYSIEHIMPQTLSPAWCNMLGEEAETIHEKWKHRLANLTLTAYNSTYQNAPFEKKRDQENGYRKSGIRMNRWIAEQEKWTESELETRNDMLLDEALKIWPMPNTSFEPVKKVFDILSLDDDETDLSGRDIARFKFKSGQMIAVKSWIDMMERVIKMLHDSEPSVLHRLATSRDDKDRVTYWVRTTPDGLTNPSQIDKDIYIERNNSTQVKVYILRKLFALYHESPSDLVFYLSDQTEPLEENNARQGRYALRRKYWTFALPIIREFCSKSYDNIKPTKENWIDGALGIRGINIRCIANYNCIQVQLLFQRDDALNKRLFDGLYARKAEIEQTLGAPLQWDRGEKTKRAKLSIELPQTKLTDESMWIRMAKFHGEWCQKFADVLVPIVKSMM